ncbi:MAG: glycosyltransferase family 2 protein [candidate division Zixibacteria bacterium]|nr:glycosyltransferase family 2 protein [candidate division Zixibacteria bacterium]
MNHNVLVAVLTYNEGEKLKELTESFSTIHEYQLLFIDDGSTDGTREFLKGNGYEIIFHERNLGVGAGIRNAVRWGRERGFEIIVIMAGNGKMQPNEIPRLVQPIIDGKADYVQGSRYLKGGYSPNLPLFRKATIKLFTTLVNIATGFRGTDITCGFRAYRLDLFDHPEINIDQGWLSKYEMEYYIHYKVLKLGYNVVEIPVSMVYPADKKNYSKIKPFVGWWSMIRPWVFLLLRIRK